MQRANGTYVTARNGVARALAEKGEHEEYGLRDAEDRPKNVLRDNALDCFLPKIYEKNQKVGRI